jgi:DNA ligase-1
MLPQMERASPGVRRRSVCLSPLAGVLGAVGTGRAWAAPLAVPLALPFPADATRLDLHRYLVSEKLDGVRACWDGAQLRFRSGLPVAAPPAWLRQLPPQPLDGELWLGRGRFEALVGCVRRAVPDPAEWAGVRYMLFDLPAHPGDFAARAEALRRLAPPQESAPWQALAQARVQDLAALQARLREVVAGGGEGLVLHRADAPYRAGRSDALLKLKPLDDAEAVVIGHVPGQGRHRGRLGALTVRRGDDGAVFRLGTGFSDAQRAAPPPVGTWVTYTHRGLTGGGLPRFPSFLRVRDDP